MPETVLQSAHKRFGVMPRATTACSKVSIEEDIAEDYLYAGAWNVGDALLQQSARVSGDVPFSDTPAANQEGLKLKLIRVWPEKNDPLTQTDLVDSEDEQVQELILRIRTSLSISHRETLANKLLRLFNDAKEEDPGSAGIAIGSLRTFIAFFQLHPTLKRPTISLTPENNVYASWRDSRRRVLSVHFLASGDVRFVIFKPNDRYPERQFRLSGNATVDILMATVAPHGVLDWITE